MASAYKFDPNSTPVKNQGVAYRPSSVPDTYSAPNVLVNPEGEEILQTTPIHLTKAEGGRIVAMTQAERDIIQGLRESQLVQSKHATADTLEVTGQELANIMIKQGWIRRDTLINAVKQERGLI